jgi:hypothetical protein
MPVISRPTPLREVAAWWGTLHGLCVGVITTLVSMGVLSTQQQGLYDNGLTAVDALVSAIIGVVSAAGPIIASIVSAKSGEKLVTPISDPHVVESGKLTPLVPIRNGRHEAIE